MKNLFVLLLLFVATPSLAATLKCKRGPVERAGIIILEELPSNEIVVFMGVDRHGLSTKAPLVSFLTGRVDKEDGNTKKTAIREAIEESGGPYSPLKGLKVKHLKHRPYIYRARIQLFVLRARDIAEITGKEVSEKSLSNAVAQALNDTSLPHENREVSRYHSVPLNQLLEQAAHINEIGLRKAPESEFTLKTVDHSIPVRVERHYMRVVARNVAKLKKIARKLFE